MALGNIICGFKDKIVNSIFETDASLFIDTSRVLGQLEGCGSEVLSTLAAHAVRPSNYGPPRLWTQEDLETIGVVFAGKNVAIKLELLLKTIIYPDYIYFYM